MYSFCSLGYNSVLVIYFVAQIVPALAIGYLAGGLMFPSDTPYPSFMSTVFLSGTTRWILWAHVGFPCLGIICFPQGLWSLLVENDI